MAPLSEDRIAHEAGTAWLSAVGDSLAESRRQGLPFAQAWGIARRIPHSKYGESPMDYRPETMLFIEAAMSRGYHRQDVLVA